MTYFKGSAARNHVDMFRQKPRLSRIEMRAEVERLAGSAQPPTLRELSDAYIAAVLHRTGTAVAAAAILGIDRMTIGRKARAKERK